ncbi:efflux RND transporter periplasmic adaptor subunit (plasmid) [Ensifer adhaerens]|uniref:efflux RND transporter periplasmic adaptor subunit n=1 Tax=Ensifer adhaerens TaxID=106592 RepID=UPI0023A9685E|nr:efflux RND transporter periplasmic adaptor subunit [Ensifer adhaerens]WDZ81060.1 efflux RND transporter periplasmic adaptor subunit [Ensifer adhaerens]
MARRSNITILIVAVLLGVAVAGFGITRKMVPADAKPTSGRHGGIVSIQTATVTLQDVPVIVHALGNVQAPDTVEVGARIASQITAIHVKDGQMVRAGDLLFTLDDRAIQAQLARDTAIVVKDTAQLSDAKTELERAKTLRDDKTGTQQTYDTALSVEQSAQATLDADRATVEADQVALSLTRITAPIDGRLGIVQVALGDLVGETGATSTNLVTITAIDPIEVTFHLPEEQLQTFKTLLDEGKPPRVRAKPSGEDTAIGEGVLDFIDSSVDAASGTIAMRATFQNGAQKLWPGQFVDIDIEREQLHQVPVIPSVAVQPGQNGPFVFHVKNDNTVETLAVKPLFDDGKLAVIASGLAPGDSVVVEGQSRLKPGDTVKAVPPGTQPLTD